MLFLTLATLMGWLIMARHENRLERTLQQLATPRLLILDELGYLPLLREGASLFFRLLLGRYERGSGVVTSNKRFADWGESSRLREKKTAGLLGRRVVPTTEEVTTDASI